MLVASPFFREPVKTFEEQKKRAAARKGRLKALAEEKQVSSSSSEEDSSSDSDDSLSSSEGLTQPTLLTSADSQSYEWVTDSDSRSYTLVTATETADAKSARTFDRSLEHESGSIGSLTLESYNDTLEDFEKKGALGPLPEGEVADPSAPGWQRPGLEGRLSQVTLPSVLEQPELRPPAGDGPPAAGAAAATAAGGPLSAYGSVGSVKSKRSLLRSKLTLSSSSSFGRGGAGGALSKRNLKRHDQKTRGGGRGAGEGSRARGSLASYLSGLSSPTASIVKKRGGFFGETGTLKSFAASDTILSTKESVHERLTAISRKTQKWRERHKYTYHAGRGAGLLLAAPFYVAGVVGVKAGRAALGAGRLAYEKWSEPPPEITKQWMLPPLDIDPKDRVTKDDFDFMPVKEYYWKRFQQWRADRRRERLDPTVLWYEQRARALNDAEYAALRAAERRQREEKERRQREWDTEQERQAWLRFVARHDNSRRDQLRDQRDFEAQVDETMMELQEAFYFERQENKLRQEAEQKRKKEEERRNRIAEERRLSREQERQRIKQEEQEGRDVTRAALAQMRRAGTIAGANARPPPEVEDDRETAKLLHLRMNPHPPDAGAGPRRRRKKGVGSKLFTVDLKRYRMVETIHAQKLGEAGGRALAGDLLLGFCPGLGHLRLGWNDLRYRGSVPLFSAFGKGAATNLVRLDLASNSMPDPVLEAFVECLKKGGVPMLQHVDFSKNIFTDKGASTICHCIIAGFFCKMITFNISKNLIRDIGAFGIYQSLTMERNTAPQLKNFNMRDNPITDNCKKRMVPLPQILHV